MERLIVLTQSYIKQTNGRQKFRIFGICVQAVSVDLEGFLVVENQAIDFTELQVRVFIWMEIVSLLKTLYGIIKMPEISETKSLVEVNFPVFCIKVQTLVEDLDGLFVSS